MNRAQAPRIRFFRHRSHQHQSIQMTWETVEWHQFNRETNLDRLSCHRDRGLSEAMRRLLPLAICQAMLPLYNFQAALPLAPRQADPSPPGRTRLGSLAQKIRDLELREKSSPKDKPSKMQKENMPDSWSC